MINTKDSLSMTGTTLSRRPTGKPTQTQEKIIWNILRGKEESKMKDVPRNYCIHPKRT
jgi:hypothetical protein